MAICLGVKEEQRLVWRERLTTGERMRAWFYVKNVMKRKDTLKWMPVL